MTTKKTISKTSLGRNVIMFPAKLLLPVRDFLIDRLKKLRVTKKSVSKEDPFKNNSRLENNASPDSDAEEQFGHARVFAIKNELGKKSAQIKRALERIKKGKYGICEDCGVMIDTDRLSVFPEATYCVGCERKREK